jgi:predicted ribosome quality control (RQC) complex YloA/Tae2 family protein
MELSGLELRYIVNQINMTLKSGYYVSSVNSVTKNSFLFRLHHPIEKEVILMISTQGIWLTKLKFKSLEESTLLDHFRRELERSKIDSIEQIDNERIVIIKFSSLEGKQDILVLEFFRDGNLILCDKDFQIISILNPVEVRHRILKIGLRYSPPPSRGTDVFNINLDLLQSLRTESAEDLEISRWIGRTMSLPKKFVEEIVHSANVEGKKLVDISDTDLSNIYASLNELVVNVSTGTNHTPVVISDKTGRYLEALPICPSNIDRVCAEELSVKKVSLYMEALDLVLSNNIINTGKNAQTGDIDKQVAALKHDIAEQDKAKDLVILKATEIRTLAAALMTYSYQQPIETSDSEPLRKLLASKSASILSSKGIKYVKVADELVRLEPNVAKTASSLFTRAKEMERGGSSIEEAKDRLQLNIYKLKNQAESIHKKHIFVKQQREKQWYERYRWFITSDGFLAIGGRDASSNSAIIRKYLTEQDLVFHAEVHGSPFFIIKNGRTSISQTSLLEVAQATVSYSRAWKDGLSTADSYWVLPGQIKKGAPSGQYLPKGSFVIEGKRNYMKGNEIRLAAGVMFINNQYSFVCGPVDAVKEKSVLYSTLLPGGYDPMEITKKLKNELYRASTEAKYLNQNEAGEDLSSYIKGISYDEIIMTLPAGKSKISQTTKGEAMLRAIPDLSIGKQKIGIDQESN